MSRSPVPLITLLIGIIIGLLLDRRVQPEKASAKPEPVIPQAEVQPRKSRTIEELSPTYKAHRDYYLSKDYEGGTESPGKHERHYRQVLDELDLNNLTELEATHVKRALVDLFGSLAYQIKEIIRNYGIPTYEED